MPAAAHRGVAVSLTPVALESDSRAIRIANALTEMGFRSIVIEGQASRRHCWGGAIEIRSAARAHPGAATAASPGSGRWWQGVASSLRDGRLGTAGELGLYLGFRGYDWWRHRHRPGRLLPSATLYYLHSFEFYRAVLPLATAARSRIIYDAHDFYRGIEPPTAQRSFDRNRLRPFLDKLEDRLAADADAIVTVSDGVATLMQDVFGRRPVVLRNCHDDRLDRLDAPDLRTMLGLRALDRLCVVIGNWKPGMAVATAVAALARLPPEFHLAFVGRGYERVAHELELAAVRGRVHHGIVLAPDAIVPAIRSADAGLVIYEPYSQNYRNALPNGFFQMIAAGIPLVRFPLPEIEAAVAGRAIGVCLDRADAASLAQAVIASACDAGRSRADSDELAGELRWANEAVRLRRLVDDLFAVRTGIGAGASICRRAVAVAQADRSCAE